MLELIERIKSRVAGVLPGFVVTVLGDVTDWQELLDYIASLENDSDRWESTARRLASESGFENSDYLRPDDPDYL